MQGGEKLSLEQIRALLEASQEVRVAGRSREETCDWVGKTLREYDYAKQGREGRGLLRSYLAKMTGQSRAQVTRLVGKYVASGEVRTTVYRIHRFPTRYTRMDTACLGACEPSAVRVPAVFLSVFGVDRRMIRSKGRRLTSERIGRADPPRPPVPSSTGRGNR